MNLLHSKTYIPLFFTSLLVLSGYVSFAQYGNMYQWQVYTKPLSAFDLISSTLPIGIEKRLAHHWLIAADYGFRLTSFPYTDKDEVDRKRYHFSKTNLEVDYLFRNRTNPGSAARFAYLGFRTLYFPQRYRLYNGQYLKNGNEYTYDYSDIKRPTWTFSLVAGKKTIGRHLMFSRYGGIGARLISISQQPYNLRPGAFTDAVEDFASHVDRYDGIHVRPNLVGGIAIGYVLGHLH